jgi:phosphatidylserine/phosphatidylglycerophosphate/cardiolipin synthase-like enzyme
MKWIRSAFPRLAVASAFIWAFEGNGAARSKAPPAFELHYSPAENLEKFDVALIDAAKRKIDVAAYVLTDVAVIEALASAAARGVKVRLYRQHTERPASGRVLEALNLLQSMPNVEQKFKPADAPFMHLKSYCVDGATLRMGAANFSASGLKHQDNDLMILRGPAVCDKFKAVFEQMWTR